MQGNNGFQSNCQIQQPIYSEQVYANNVQPPIYQFHTTEIGSEFVEQIKRDGVEEYKAKQNRHPSYSGRQLLIDRSDTCMVLQTIVNNETKNCVRFCTGTFEAVTKCNYEKWFPFSSNYMVEVQLPGAKEPKEVVIEEDAWGKKEMLRIFNENGISFQIKLSDSQILRILMDYLANFFVNQTVGVIDPRAGWFESNGMWQYRLAERWEIKEIPSYAAHKSIGNGIEETTDRCLSVWAEWIQGITSEGLKEILIGVVLFGLNASHIYRELSCWQERTLIIRCSDERVKRWIKEFLCFFREDAEKNLTLACKTKDLQEELMAAKDQVLVIDGDAVDVSDRRKRSVAILQDYVVNGFSTSDISAQSLVVVLTKGIVEGFPMDEALIIDVKRNDFTEGILNDHRVRHMSSYLVAGFILWIEENPIRFINEIKSYPQACETMIKRLAMLSSIGCRILNHVVVPDGFIFDFNSGERRLLLADEWLDVTGLGTVVIEVMVRLLIDGSLRLRLRNETIETEWLQDTVFWDKKEVFVTQSVLKKWILPHVASIDTPILSIVKALYDEGYLKLYDSVSCHNNYQKRLLLYDMAGKKYSPWAIAIPSEHFNRIQAGVLEEAQYGE